MSAATPEHIMQVGLGFWASKTLLSAVELGVFSTLADAPADLPTTRLHPPGGPNVRIRTIFSDDDEDVA